MKNRRSALRGLRLLGLWMVCLGMHVAERSAVAGDWPQILGPMRNGIAEDEQLAADWNQQVPTKVWEQTVGEGYAGPAVADGKVFLFHRTGQKDVLDCFDSMSGERDWRLQWKATYRSRIDPDAGPRCVPLVRDGRVFVLAASGQLHCASIDGKAAWSVNLAKDTKARDGYFGFGSTPILMGDTLMVNVGGRDEQSILGIDPKNGKTKWSSFTDGIAEASYSAPAERRRAGKAPTAVFVTRLNLVEIDPSDGRVLSQMPFGSPGTTVNAATPLMLGDDRVFLTASYRIGAKCVRLRENGKPTVLWESDSALSSQYPTPVYVSGHLFGVHGREDGALASLRCVEAETGKVKWKQDRVGMAHLIHADGKAIMLKVSGELVLFRTTTDQYEELGSIRVSSEATRALPALSDGRLYTRDTGGNLSAWQLPKRVD